MYYQFVKGKEHTDIAKALSELATKGYWPCGNLFCNHDGDGSTLLHFAAKKKIPGHVPEKLFYAAAGKELDKLKDQVNDLNQQAEYIVMGDVFYWKYGGMWIQMMVLKRFA